MNLFRQKLAIEADRHEYEDDTEFIDLYWMVEVQKNDPSMIVNEHYPAARFHAIICLKNMEEEVLKFRREKEQRDTEE